MQQNNPKRHKHADLIHAWAEGAEIEYLALDGRWLSYPCPDWTLPLSFRIKPKLVKKWKWVIHNTKNGKMLVTDEHYQSQKEFDIKCNYTDWVAILKINSTEIEVEET